MSDHFFESKGKVCQVSDLTIKKAIELAHILCEKTLPFVEFIECRKLEPHYEIIVFDTEIEIGQRVKFDIHKVERIAVHFHNHDEFCPEVYALRVDFPKVMHINVRNEEFPRSLCLYEESYSEIKLRWTPIKFISEIREWLALNAKGQLHQEDQALERVLLEGKGRIIIPSDLFHDPDVLQLLTIARVVQDKYGFITLLTKRISEKHKESPFIVIPLGIPLVHGLINRTPDNIFELHNLLLEIKKDLLFELRELLKAWLSDKPFENYLNAKLILTIAFFKKRYAESKEPENIEIWTFASKDFTIGEIGQQIGIYEKYSGNYGLKLGSIDPKHNGENIQIYPLNTDFYLSRNNAAVFNGCTESNIKISAIGLGALGSQVFFNLVRAGFGEWTLIDNDQLLPHNLSRHVLMGPSIGESKVKSLAYLANRTIDGPPIAKDLEVNVLKPDTQKEEFLTYLKESDLILDMSTSVAVERFLARDIDSKARRITLFLTPSGADLVLFSEDVNRKIKLDQIEMQYYKLLINNSNLEGHLSTNKKSFRYSNSCRDRSFIISQDLVALHSALGSRGVRLATSNPESSINIWRTISDDLQVKCIKFQPKEMEEYQFGDWHLYIDPDLKDKLWSYRQTKLPNETGGILIGAHDVQRKIVYIIDTEFSPPDSHEWPTVYIRGCKGLRSRVERIKDITLGMIGYVGEWHSHPEGYGISPSSDDNKAFNWLANYMNQDGLPALMFIVGNNLLGIYLGEMVIK